MAFLGHLAKLKRGLGLVFGAHFLHDFSIKMFLVEYPINGQSGLMTDREKKREYENTKI